jgi:hypothetical protein
LFSSLANADQVPKRLSFDGIVLDNTDDPYNGTFTVVFKIYNDSTGGTAVWTETQSSVVITNGVLSRQLGYITAIEDGVFSSSSKWLGITVGLDSERSPRLRFLSVPYSHRVNTIDGANGGTLTGNVTVIGNVTVTGNETVTGNITATGTVEGLKGKFGTSLSATGITAFATGTLNSATGSYSSVGGYTDTVSGSQSSVVSGRENVAAADYAFIGGGRQNRINISGSNSSIGGGTNNTVSGSGYGFIGGGYGNTVTSSSSIVGGSEGYVSGSTSSIAGGSADTVSGSYAFIGAGNKNKIASNYSGIVGGKSNWIGSLATNSVIGGGSNNRIIDTLEQGAVEGFIGGGSFNTIYRTEGAIGGGFSNRIYGLTSTIAGGRNNLITMHGSYSAIVGGDSGVVDGIGGFVGCGFRLIALGDYSAVISGGSHRLESSLDRSTAAGEWSLIVGGRNQRASDSFSVVVGGQNDTAQGKW